MFYHVCAICPIHWITAFGQQYESRNTWLSTFLRILIDLQYYISKITAHIHIFKFIILQRLSQRSIISTVSSLMKPWKIYKSCNFWNEVFYFYQNCYEEIGIRREKEQYFPCSCHLNYLGFQRDKRNRERGFKRHVERMEFSILKTMFKNEF